MNTEKIYAAALERYPDYENPGNAFNPAVPQFKRESFTAGVHFAAENPSLIGCVTVEEAMRFSEWLSLKGYSFAFMSDNRSVPPMWFLYGQLITSTTAELFDIFKQQKP